MGRNALYENPFLLTSEFGGSRTKQKQIANRPIIPLEKRVTSAFEGGGACPPRSEGVSLSILRRRYGSSARFFSRDGRDRDDRLTGMWRSLVLLGLCCCGGVLGNPDAKRLYDDLMSSYNRLIRPVSNNSDTLTVKMGLKLSQLIDVVSTPHSLIVFTSLLMKKVY
ncbi:neur_chan_LBD domain-containing protein [Caerostris darwini]|uniref:Neur_chan_LBD domain-containing protein n=1 Tax=Caerostris darwini TaxID=1538125 RepID=A0AAV4VSU3_9ARAC|nr:neur_chan_LBD domain-containing protein [Caerostris darwini]